jgi:hypothetical protein
MCEYASVVSIPLLASVNAIVCFGETTTRPNIVFVLADDLGHGDLSCYGQKTLATWNLDRLAAEGMRFTRHYAGSTVCAPSEAAKLRRVASEDSWFAPVFVPRRSSEQEIRAFLECGGLTPLSFCVSFAFCEKAVGGAVRKKGTAKAASSHRTPKKANRPVGNKNRYVPGVQDWAKTVQTEHARSGVVFGQAAFHRVDRWPKTTPDPLGLTRATRP